MALYEIFNDVRSAYPDHIGISTQHQRLMYREIDSLALKCDYAVSQYCSHTLAPVVVSLPNGHSAIFPLFLGIIKSGRIYFYLDPATQSSIKESLLASIQPAWIINEKVLQFIMAIDFHQPCQQHINQDVHAPSILVQTSGTSSQSRIVAITQHALLHNVSNYQDAINITSEDRLSLLTSPQFSAANSAIYAALLSGAGLFPFAVKAHGLQDFIAWIAREQITILHLTPSLFRLLAEYIGYNTLPSIRVIKLGGELVYQEDVTLYKKKFASHCVLINGLGMSEAAGNITHYVIDHETILPSDSNIVPIGRVLRGHEVMITDERGQPLPVGHTGELIIRSEYLANGYWHEPEETAKKFKRVNQADFQIELQTGDCGYFLAEGLLVHLGRKDRQIKRNGFRVDLNVVESKLSKLNGIKRAAVYYTQLDDIHHSLIASVQLSAGHCTDNTSILQQLEKCLPAYMVPQYIFILPEFPLTNSGKIDHQTILRQLRESRKNKLVVKPRNLLETQLTRLWQDILKRDDIGVYDDFFETGGDSLRAMELLARMHRELKLTCDLTVLQTHPVIAQLAENMDYHLRASEANMAPVEPVPLKISLLTMQEHPENTLPPLIFIPGGPMSEKELSLVAGLLAYLPMNRTIYAIRLNLQETVLQLPHSVGEIATAIAASIRNNVTAVAPVLIGECISCTLTAEVARQLASSSGIAPPVILLNPWHPRLPTEAKPDIRPQHIIGYLNLLRAWHPLPYTGSLDLIFAEQQLRTPTFFLDWWQDKTKNTCNLHRVPGDSRSYIRQHRAIVAGIIHTICQRHEVISSVC
jgi:acyl-coenzyme A synthetase/AMP-(fatty) acid ligase/aryl carrier-like protein